MASETIYFKDKHTDVLDSVEAQAPGVENRSQAVQYVINEYAQLQNMGKGDSNESE